VDNVNVICPVTHSAELNNISEYSPDHGLTLTNEDAVLKAQLEEIINDLYAEVEHDTELPADSPEVVFSKYLYVIKLKTNEIEKVKAAADKLILDISGWQDQKTAQHQSQIDFLSARMELYLRGQHIKSLQLPPGSIGLRKQQPKIEIIDEVVFYENADESILRRVPESFEPNLKAIKEQLKATGEIPPGADLIEQDSKFYYKLN
jgi:hypothetical protein